MVPDRGAKAYLSNPDRTALFKTRTNPRRNESAPSEIRTRRIHSFHGTACLLRLDADLTAVPPSTVYFFGKDTMPHWTVPNGHTYEILVVDDNPADSKLLEMAFAECNHVSTHVSVLHKCSDVIDYMFGRGKYADARRPDLIIVDYHMPLDGGMALVELKGNPHVQCTPVLVMTGTDNPTDVDDIYRRHANACFLRPIDLDSSSRLVCSIAEHWLTEVMLPPPAPHQHGTN